MPPVAEADRIASLDVLRGFALLGILLLNIIGFGMVSTAYSVPAEAMESALDVGIWASVDLFAEGAMRALFSILFGAGVVLFATGASAKGAGTHYRRNFWLLVFGLFDAYVLLWNGDILINYALGGAVLYLVRNAPPKRLAIAAASIVVLMSLFHLATNFGLSLAREASVAVAAGETNPDAVAAAKQWDSFYADQTLSEAERADELEARTQSYASAFAFNVEYMTYTLVFVLPVYLFWDALAMMLLGMAWFKWGVLQGKISDRACWRLAIGGFAIGLTVNGYEVTRTLANDFDILNHFAQLQWTYHIGRLGMAMGYIGLFLLLLRFGRAPGLMTRFAAVGRMALTNYLMHSLICLIIFTGAGFALVDQLTRAQLYLVVLGIWVLQMILSPWWLARFTYGPVEYLWRYLTYGAAPRLRRSAS